MYHFVIVTEIVDKSTPSSVDLKNLAVVCMAVLCDSQETSYHRFYIIFSLLLSSKCFEPLGAKEELANSRWLIIPTLVDMGSSFVLS